jgi:hypothetical protein
MNQTATSPHQSPASQRDLRLDFFRGLALLCIFIDHIPETWLSIFTIRITGLYDAAEIFIFISGYTAGIVYGRIMEMSGTLIMTLRVLQRVWQLYVTHVFLFVLFMALLGNMADTINNPIYAEEFRAADFIKEPGIAITQALILQFQPDFMDILPLYIVLLIMLPLFLMGLQRMQWVVLTLSFGLWLLVQFNKGIALPTYPDPDTKWFFNPFAWQFLFLFGAALGRMKSVTGTVYFTRTWLTAAAWFILLVGFVVQTGWTLHIFDPTTALWSDYSLLALDKSDLSPPRLINALASLLIVSTLVKPDAPLLKSRFAWPFMVCGRHSLYIFCLGILLSAVGHWIIAEFYGDFWPQTFVLMSGMVIMVLAAAFIEWFTKSQSERKKTIDEKGTRGGVL